MKIENTKINQGINQGKQRKILAGYSGVKVKILFVCSGKLYPNGQVEILEFFLFPITSWFLSG